MMQAGIMADSMVEEIKKISMAGQQQGTQQLQLPQGKSNALLALPSLMGSKMPTGAR
jgi:hypothetical protein